MAVCARTIARSNDTAIVNFGDLALALLVTETISNLVPFYLGRDFPVF